MSDSGENSSDWDFMFPKEYHEQLLTFNNILIEPLFPVATEPTVNLWKPDFVFDEKIPENLEGIPILQGEEIPDNLTGIQLPQSSGSFETTFNKVRRFLCDKCGKMFLRLRHLKEHYHLHEDVKAYIFTDHSYARKFFIRRNSEDHIHKLHHSEGPFGCTKWGKLHMTHEGFDNHHLPHRHYECIECGKTNIRKKILENHQLTHSVRETFKCKLCKRTFHQKRVLSSHIRMCRFRAAEKKPKQKPSTIARATAQRNANMGGGNDGTEEQPCEKNEERLKAIEQ